MAGPRTDRSGQIQRTNGNGASRDLVGLLSKMQPEIARALPKHVTPDRMGRIVLTALRTTPKLAECTPESFLGCVMQLSQLGLEPNTPLGHSYLIPRWSGKRQVTECTMQIGYQGYIELARRSGQVDALFAYAVREGDVFEYQLGLRPDIKHVPSSDPKREDKAITYVYSVAHLKGTSNPVFVVLSRAQIEARKARSDSASKGFSPWQTDYEAMALKSAVRALWKWLPKSSELPNLDAIETTIETGKPLAQAFDPAVSEALEKHGLLDAGDVDAATGEVIDIPETEAEKNERDVRERAAEGEDN